MHNAVTVEPEDFVAAEPSGSLAFYLDAGFGKTIDFANGRQAERLGLTPEVELNIGNRFSGDLSHTLQRLDVAPDRLFDARLTQSRLIYPFNIRTFVRAIVQYTDIKRNPETYLFDVNPRSRQLFTQFLFSYKLNPRTVFLAGYSDSALGLADRDHRRIDLTKTVRTLFFKIGYALLF